MEEKVNEFDTMGITVTKQGQELIQENIPTAQASRFQTFMRKLANVVINAELVIALVVMVAVLLPPVIGIKPYCVLTGSMEPALPVGSMAYIDTNVDAKDLQKGDIVTFRVAGESSDKVVTHRLVENDKETGQLTTQGDANKAVDNGRVAYENVLGKTVECIPYLGYMVTFVMDNKIKLIIGLVIFNVVLLYASRSKKVRIGATVNQS